MKTKQWYWAYSDGIVTWLFNSIDEARERAIKQGMFDEICGKDAYMDFDEQLFFEVSESDLKDCQPFLFAPKAEVQNGINA